MSNIEHCWRCHGTGQMDLDRGQWTEHATCIYCKGTGDFQERRKGNARRADDRGAVEECERLRVFERAFAKVPQEQQARIMDAVRADTADGGQYVAKEDAAQSCWVVGGCYEENRLRLIEGRALGAHEQLTLVEASE